MSINTSDIEDPVIEEQETQEPEPLAGPYLFDNIQPGFHDGFVVDILGMSIFSIREQFGIESIVALANNGTAESYFDWVQLKVGTPLNNWEPVKLTLYNAWVASSPYSSDLPMSYRIWHYRPEYFEALAIRPVDVFALRHKAWRLLEEGRIREFNVAMQRSHMEARWSIANPGRDLVPEDMDGDAGFVVSGKARGRQRQERLTWPVADIGEVIKQAEALKKKRVSNLVIYEAGGVGFPFNKSTHQQWMKIAELDRSLGNNGFLLDLLRSVGAVSW